MARTFSRARRTYQPGVYGPFRVDSFTKESASRLVATMTVEGWPDVSPLMSVELAWDSGGVARFDVSGEQRDDQGQLMPEVSFSFSIPRDAGVRRDVAEGSATVTVFAPITTAVSLAAV